MDKSIEKFFKPKGIVLVGASKNPNKLGYGLAKNLVESEFPGEVFFVNTSGGELLGKKVYESIQELPGKVDLAVLLISSEFAYETLKECKDKGIYSVIISSGGFKEVGNDGALLEKKCIDFANENEMALMGPNCIGLIDTHYPINTTFLQESELEKGSIGFISHSGAICAAMLNWSQGQGFGFSKLVSLGNQADVNETDVLDFVGNDLNSNVISMYLEGVSDGRQFVSTGKKITPTKPVIALKVGRSKSGQKAVASHTGALAGEDIAFDAAFRRAGILRAKTIEGMFESAKTLAYCQIPTGKKVAILTNAGGPGVTATDALELNKLEISNLDEKTKEKLNNILPDSASVENPVDMLASASPEDYSLALSAIYADENVDMVMVILPPPPMFPAENIVEAIAPIIKANSFKPSVVIPMGDSQIQEAVKKLREFKIPEFRFPENAANSLGSLHKYSKVVQRQNANEIVRKDINQDKVKKILSRSDISKDDFMSEELAHKILEAYKIPVLKMELAENPNDARLIAEKIGFPVALKISSTDIQHKSDIGGVLLNLKSKEDVDIGFKKLVSNAQEKFPKASIAGVHIQKMATSGQEVIIGAIQDPQFGPLVMFGSGGTEVEGLEDIKFSLAPLTQEDIDYMLLETWAGKKLDGYRNIHPADRTSLEDALIRLAQLVSDFPEISEIEINPLNVLEGSNGVIAVDVRIKMSG